MDPYEFASFGDDFLPFVAKNQFKSQLRKLAPLPKAGSLQEKIATIMNPMQTTLTKDHVRVLIEVIPKAAAAEFLPAIDSMGHYRYLKNLLEEEKAPQIRSVELSAIRRYMFKSDEIPAEEQKSNVPVGLASLAADPGAASA